MMCINRGMAFWLRVVAPQNQGDQIRDMMISGLQRDRSQTDQAYSRWLELPSLYGKVLHTLKMCCLTCVSSVQAFDMWHISPPHCRATLRGDTMRVCKGCKGKQCVNFSSCCSLQDLLSLAASWWFPSSSFLAFPLCLISAGGCAGECVSFVVPPHSAFMHVHHPLLKPWHCSVCAWHLWSLVTWWFPYWWLCLFLLQWCQWVPMVLVVSRSAESVLSTFQVRLVLLLSICHLLLSEGCLGSIPADPVTSWWSGRWSSCLSVQQTSQLHLQAVQCSGRMLTALRGLSTHHTSDYRSAAPGSVTRFVESMVLQTHKPVLRIFFLKSPR